MASQLKLSSLGRPFNLGMLYDCRTEKLIPGSSLWDAKKIESALQVTKTPGSHIKIIADESIRQKFLSLSMGAELKLSFMCGLVDVDGAANYLLDENPSQKQSRVSLQYASTTRLEELKMDQIGNIQLPDQDIDATHVVTGIQYGADAFLVFDRSLEGDEKVNDVRGRMEAAVQSVTSQITQGDSHNDSKHVNKIETDKFQCKFHGDINPKSRSNPSSFDETIELCKDLHELDHEGVPKQVYLFPLSKLQPEKSQQTINLVSSKETSRVEELVDDFHNTEMRINDLLNHDICSKFVDTKSQLQKLKDLLTRFKTNFIKDLAQILPKIRSAGEKEEKLAELISSVHASPFSSSAMGKHLHDKEKEINYLAQCLKNVEKDPKIQFDFPNTDCNLSELKSGINVEQVACFGFNVTTDTSPYIQSLEHYLHNGIAITVDQQEWFDTSMADQLKVKLNHFIEFVQASTSKKNRSYVLTHSDSSAKEQNPSLILYWKGVPIPFDPPGRPGIPTASDVTTNSISLKWTAPSHGGDVLSYRVQYRSLDDSTAKELKTVARSCKISGLAPKTSYMCQVYAHGDCNSVVKSEPCEIRTKRCAADITLATRFIDHSNLIESEASVPIYKLPLELIIEDKRNRLRKYEIALPNSSSSSNIKPEKVLMVLGATGAGKSTLINGMANYILGVTWKDNFRFKVVTDEGNQSQAFSQTRDITAYSFLTTDKDFNLTVVDTPGFGDTGGIENDRKIAEQIKRFFSGKRDTCSIDQIHGIGFVTQASMSRLTPTQRFIFTSILSIFGKDIKDNIFLMTTFADANTPPVLEAVRIANIPYNSCFKFNNSALFAANKSSQISFDSMFWEMGYVSFKEFFQQFSQAEAKSLALTREVLREREQLETLIPKLQEQVRIGMARMDEIRQEEAILKQHETDLNANKDFVYEIEVTAFRKVDLKSGIHTTTCQVCNFTCHNRCAYGNNEDKRKCCAMRSTENCTVCPNKCHWSEHLNVPYIIEYYKKKETRTSDDLKKRYDSARTGKESVEAMITENEDRLCTMHVEVHQMIERTHKSIERLKEIALKPNPLNEIEYLDLLIESEKQEAKTGWKDRVLQLQDFREDAKLYQKVSSGQFTLDAAVELDKRPHLVKRIKTYFKQSKAYGAVQAVKSVGSGIVSLVLGSS